MRSKGVNVPSAHIEEVSFKIPLMPREQLIVEARLHYDSHPNARLHGHAETKERLERKCVNYLRHSHTNYDYLRIRAYGEHYFRLARCLFDAIIAVYPWLRTECEYQYSVKQRHKSHKTIKVLGASLSSQHVDDFNAAQNVAPEVPVTEEEEVPLFFKQLSSLDQERFLYLPPFLKPDQIRERRFGENASDRWWEWEEELNLTSSEGRPDPANAQY